MTKLAKLIEWVSSLFNTKKKKGERYDRLNISYKSIYASEVITPLHIEHLFKTLKIPYTEDSVRCISDVEYLAGIYATVTGKNAEDYLVAMGGFNPTIISSPENMCKSLLLSMIMEAMKPLL